MISKVTEIFHERRTFSSHVFRALPTKMIPRELDISTLLVSTGNTTYRNSNLDTLLRSFEREVSFPSPNEKYFANVF